MTDNQAAGATAQPPAALLADDLEPRIGGRRRRESQAAVAALRPRSRE